LPRTETIRAGFIVYGLGFKVQGSVGKTIDIELIRLIPGFFLRSGADKDMKILALPRALFEVRAEFA